jgi:TolB-like protein/tetratricopeptide (TPR) repeat protein
MSLFNELKRRNVIRVATAYLVVGWLLIQILGIATDSFEAPAWVMKLAITMIVIGFFISLIISWVYELTPEGIKKEKDINPDDSITNATSKKLNYITIIAAFAVAGMFAWQQINPNLNISSSDQKKLESMEQSGISTNTENTKNTKTKEETVNPSQIKNNTIAVLPFSDMSPNKDQEYFSDGISEEILNVLAKIPDLQITSRSSAFSFKGTNTDIPTIAKKLGVANVLEGSVRKSGTTIRITAQLIDARTDKHLWSETYDRELTDVFKVQDEISAAIVKALRETLGITVTKPEVIAKVIDPQAYDYYLKALQQKNLNSFDSLKAAVNYSHAALKIDPNFSLAKLTLADTLLSQILTGSESNPELIEQAEKLVNDVLALEPDLNPAYMTLAFVHIIKGEFKKRIQALDKAYELDPNNPRTIVLYLGVHKDKISEKQSSQLLNKAQQLDPLNAEIPYLIGIYYYGYKPDTRDKAEMYFKRAMELNPNDGTYSFLLGTLYAANFADIPKAIEQFKTIEKTDPKDPDSAIYLSKSYAALGDVDKALAYASLAIQKNPHSGDAYVSQITALILKGDNTAALDLVNATNTNPEIFHRSVRGSKNNLMILGVYLLLEKKEYASAKDLIESLAPGTEQLLNKPAPQSVEEIGNPKAIELLVAIYRTQSQNQSANQLASGLQLLLDQPKSLGRFDNSLSDQLKLAEIAATQQKNDLAIDYLSSVIEGGSILGWRTTFLYNPMFSGLHDNPRYQAIITKIEAKMADQKKIVEASDSKESQMVNPQ